jgi:hypothetical protein
MAWADILQTSQPGLFYNAHWIGWRELTFATMVQPVRNGYCSLCQVEISHSSASVGVRGVRRPEPSNGEELALSLAVLGDGQGRSVKRHSRSHPHRHWSA